MRIVRQITRFIGRWGIYQRPDAQQVTVYLEESNGSHFIVTPWACLNAVNGAATTDEQMAAALHTSFATGAEAQAHARAACPYFDRPDNLTVNGRLHDAIRWHGNFVGGGQLADALGVSPERLYAIARGEVKATRAQAAAATGYHGKAI